MRTPQNHVSRRELLGALSGSAAALALAGTRLNAAQAANGADGKAQRIVSVKAYPVRLIPNDERSDIPKFKSDFDPARWRYRGPFAQLNSAIIVVIRTDQGVTGYGLGAGGSVAYWRVPGIAAAVEHFLACGAGLVSPAREVGDGISVARVSDPFGNVIGLIENPHFPNTGAPGAAD